MSSTEDFVRELQQMRKENKLSEQDYTLKVETMLLDFARKTREDCQMSTVMEQMHAENLEPHLRTFRAVKKRWDNVLPAGTLEQKNSGYKILKENAVNSFTMLAKSHSLSIAEMVYGSYFQLGLPAEKAQAYLDYILLKVSPENKILHHNVFMLCFYPKADQEMMTAAVLKLQLPLFPPVNNDLITLNTQMLTAASDETMTGGAAGNDTFFADRSWLHQASPKKATVRGGAYSERIINEQGEQILALQMDNTENIFLQLMNKMNAMDKKLSQVSSANSRARSNNNNNNNNYQNAPYRGNNGGNRGRGRGNYNGRGYVGNEEDDEAYQFQSGTPKN
ncbi:hypothetical protein, conserved [Angomonas deanei]|uniref:Uncharacterized protein n=1 Tax=Angomonas deanei TaxID=59799 RepID=A0A7G2CTB6_9TRYP|nr:hypothetical protein, conserved [Angomonas deanei]